MSFTRFNDDPCRIKKQLQESTGTGRYMLNKPGWGANPCFMDDPYIRMEQWGANLQTNSINYACDVVITNDPTLAQLVTINTATDGVASLN